MRRVLSFYQSTLGKKAAMAVSGFILFGFVVMHLYGNLKLFLGPEALNHYAEGLRELGQPVFARGHLLWLARFGLLAAVGVHIHSAVTLTLRSRAARPEGYAVQRFTKAGYAERTMRFGGLIILLFVLYHLAHLTFGWVHSDFVPGDVYHNVVAGFRVWWVSAFYIVAQLALALHLSHGLWSMFQTLGWHHPKYEALKKNLAIGFASLICLGNIALPVAVLSGYVS